MLSSSDKKKGCPPQVFTPADCFPCQAPVLKWWFLVSLVFSFFSFQYFFLVTLLCGSSFVLLLWCLDFGPSQQNPSPLCRIYLPARFHQLSPGHLLSFLEQRKRGEKSKVTVFIKNGNMKNVFPSGLLVHYGREMRSASNSFFIFYFPLFSFSEAVKHKCWVQMVLCILKHLPGYQI